MQEHIELRDKIKIYHPKNNFLIGTHYYYDIYECKVLYSYLLKYIFNYVIYV